ncbi:MAG: hypothetical protein H6Q15_1243 [Bacteroidetes bacterium]|nr:hypothetical protein [Bacteroidota bacterium]
MKLFVRIIFVYCSILFIQISQSTSYAQLVKTEDYSFINNKENRIEYYGKSEDLLNPFYAQIRQMILFGKSQIKILHIGDSQIESNTSTERFRQHLQNIMPGLISARGMVSLNTENDFYRINGYKINLSENWKINNITSKEDYSDQGLWATTISSKEKESNIDVLIDYKSNIKSELKTFRIYHSPINNDSASIIIDDLNFYYKSTYFPNEGYTRFELKEYSDEIKIRVINNSNRSIDVYGLYFETSDDGFIYNSSAIYNLSSIDILNAEKYFSQYSTLDFDLIILSLGKDEAYNTYYNSESFKKNISEIILRLRAKNNKLPIILTTPIDSYYQKKTINPRIKQADDDIIDIAKSQNCAIWDINKIMGGKGSSKKWKEKNLMSSDLLHLTIKGELLQGDLFYNAFWKSLENYVDNRK